MSTTIGKLNFMVTADASGVRTGLIVGEQALGGFAAKVTNIYQSIRAQFALNPFSQVAGWAVQLAASAESAAIKFEVLLGSASAARQTLQQLQALDVKTPFDYQQLRDGAEQLLIYGVNAQAVVPMLSMLGDISAGNSERLGRLSYALGQVNQVGHLTGMELRQMTEAGFSPLENIAKRTGETMAQVRQRMSAGGVGIREVVQAMQDATSAGGRFHNLSERMSQTLEGRWSSLVSTAKLLATEVGEKLMPALKSLTEVGISAVEWVKNMDAGTAQTAVKIVAMTAAFAGAISIVPKIVAGAMAIVRALKAIATGQAIAQALSGPAGWATLAVGLAAAVGAGLAVNAMFDGVASSAAKAGKQVNETKKDISGLFSALDVDNSEALKGQLAQIKQEAKDVKKHFDDMRKAIEGRRGVFTSALERGAVGTSEGLARAGQEGLIQKELQKLREQELAQLKRIEEQEKAIEKAIENKQPISVTERRI